MIVRVGEKNMIPFSGRRLRGVQLYFYAIHVTANTAFVASDFDFVKANLRIVLTRNGKSYEIASECVKVLAMESSMGNAQMSIVAPTNGLPITVVAPAAGVFAEAIFPLNVEFGGTMDLQGADKIEATLQSTRADIVPANVNATSSYYDIDILESDGLEMGIPCINTMVVQPGERNNSYALMGQTKRVVFINTNATTKLNSAQVIQGINLSSNIASCNDDYYDFITKQASYMAKSDFDLLGQSGFIYGANGLMDNVRIDANFNSANVLAGCNYFVWRTLYNDGSSMLRTDVRMKALVNDGKVGVNSNPTM